MKPLAILFLLLSLLTQYFGGSGRTPSLPYQEKEIPTVDFCQMIKHPELYFDRIIRISATFLRGQEVSSIMDVRCVQRFEVKIGVGVVAPEKQAKSLQHDLLMIGYGRFGEQPRVTMTGILRNDSQRNFNSREGFSGYRYWFDIIGFEKMGRDPAQELTSYNGLLHQGYTYQATVRGDSDFGLAFVFPLRMRNHQAVRLEWTNLEKFSELQHLPKTDHRLIVFRVVSDEVQQMTPQRWNRTVSLEILLVE